MIRRVVALTGTARPRPTPATAVLMPDDAAAPVDERAAGVARVERRVGLDHVVDDAHRAARAGRQRAAERGDDAGGHRAGEAVRVADRDDELADAQRAPRRRAAPGRAPARRRAARRGRRAGRRRRLRSVSSRPSVNDAADARGGAPSTTCAEVSRKPSGVIRPRPEPRAGRCDRGGRGAGWRPTATPLAATCVTTREYASSASVSSGGGASEVTCRTIATQRWSAPAAPHARQRRTERADSSTSPSVRRS